MSYISIYLPKTSVVLRSAEEIGVPVNPIKVALGRLSRIILAIPTVRFAISSPCSFLVIFIFSVNPYCPRCASSAITTIFLLSDNATPYSSNFCIVVKIIPLACLPSNNCFK